MSNELASPPNQVLFFKFDLEHLIRSVTSGILPLSLAVALSIFLDQFVTGQVERLLKSSDGPTGFVWVWLSISIALTVIFPACFTLISCYFITEKNNPLGQKSFLKFFTAHFELVILEGMRAIAYTFFWFFAFIIPAFFKFANYALTPFVVIYSKKYQDGQIDALKESKRIGLHSRMKLFVLLIGLYIALPLISTLAFDEYKVFANSPMWAFALSLLDALGIFLFHFFALRFFKSAFFEQGESYGSDV